MDKNYSHIPVLLTESIEALNIQPNGIYVDCTLGGGGHSLEIAKQLDKGILVCIDQDECAIKAAENRLSLYKDKIRFVKDNFSNIGDILDSLPISRIDGALLDLGVSSYQLDTPERGFSYQASAPLDMRMNTDASFSAYDLVNTYPNSSAFFPNTVRNRTQNVSPLRFKRRGWFVQSRQQKSLWKSSKVLLQKSCLLLDIIRQKRPFRQSVLRSITSFPFWSQPPKKFRNT